MPHGRTVRPPRKLFFVLTPLSGLLFFPTDLTHSMKYLSVLALFTFFLLGCEPVNGQGETDRQEQIRANLRFHYPQLRDYELTINEIEPSGIEGIDRGSFTVDGRQTQGFLVTEDNTRLYMIAGDPVDVSKSTEELEADLAAQAEEEAETAREQHEELMAALPDLPARGNPDAPVTIVEFSDFQCPYCARGYQTMEQVLASYPDTVRFVFAHYPLPNHDWARPAAIAAECADAQDEAAFWALHDAYFENQQQFTTDNLIAQSREVLTDTGIDLSTWEACTSDTSSAAYQEAASTVDEAMAVGQQFGISGTPGFFVNGYPLSGAQPPATFERTIERALETAQ